MVGIKLSLVKLFFLTIIDQGSIVFPTLCVGMLILKGQGILYSDNNYNP
jgi:hypothetical protein